MKKIITTLILVFCAINFTSAQVGIGTTTPKGALDVNSDNMGLVIPIVTDLTAVTTPDGDPAVDGTIVFDATNGRLCMRVNSRWSCFGDDGQGGTSLASFYDPATVFQNPQAYLKASNIDFGDSFGERIAISGDGNTLVVGAPFEGSDSATDQTNNSAFNSGAAYVFTRNGSDWIQQAYLKAPNIGGSDRFGFSVAINANGTTIAVGAILEDSNSASDPSDNNTFNSGAVYIYTYDGTAWGFESYLKASDIDSNDQFGYSVSLDASGNRLAVGVLYEDSDGNPPDDLVAGNEGGTMETFDVPEPSAPNNNLSNSGAVYVFARTGTTWAEQAFLKASNPGANDQFGQNVVFSDDGNTLAVGTTNEDSNSISDPSNNDASNSGAVYIFTYDGSAWTEEAYLKPDIIGSDDNFGNSIALSVDGNTMAIGAFLENSGNVSDPNDSSMFDAGAAYIFTRNNAVWTQEAYIKAPIIGSADFFGQSVSLSDDSNTLAVGATGEDSNSATDPANNFSSSSGAVYIFKRNGTTWSQGEYLKAFVIGGDDRFGFAVSISADGTLLAVGAPAEDSDSAADPNNNSAGNSGAAYVLSDAND